MAKKHRIIKLDNLPMKGKLIDWKNSIGRSVYFEYDDVKGYVEIIDYKDSYLKIKFYNNEIEIFTGSFVNVSFGKLLNKQTGNFKINIGDKFKDEKRDIEIIDREIRTKQRKSSSDKQKWNKYKCNKCPNEDWIEESNLLHNRGCNVCCIPSQKTIIGYNDIPTTDPWMVKYFQGGYDEAKKYTCRSNKAIHPVCPDCGRVKDKPMKIYTIYQMKSIGCNCSDGVSYPNKFMYNILEQLNIKFITEYSPKWLNKRRFDFYIPSKQLIIEMDGSIGHGHKDSINGTTKEESKAIDNWKDKQANIHNLKVIRIDCNYKNHNKKEYIYNSIINSELILMFDFSNINWSIADKYATKNKIKFICEYYEINKDKMLIKDMSKHFNINPSTFLSYLKRGNKFNWCNYDKDESIEMKFKLGKTRAKKVKIVETGDIFKSAIECDIKSEELYGIKFTFGGICSSCRNNKPYKGFHFEYIDQ